MHGTCHALAARERYRYGTAPYAQVCTCAVAMHDAVPLSRIRMCVVQPQLFRCLVPADPDFRLYKDLTSPAAHALRVRCCCGPTSPLSAAQHTSKGVTE